MRILLIEDHQMIRFAVSTAIRLAGIDEVVGETDSAEEGFALAEAMKPDLVVLDLRLEGAATGVEMCRDLKALCEPPRVLVFTAHDSVAELYLCLVAGADGYVHKSASFTELVEAIKRVGGGEEVWLLRNRSEDLVALLRAIADDSGLSGREKEVLELAVRGYPNARIARELFVSVPTVKSHMRHILTKLELQKRSDIPSSRLWEPEQNHPWG